MGIEITYKDRDNANSFILKENRKAVDLSGVLKMVLSCNTYSINSDDNPEVFDWSDGNGKLSLILGLNENVIKDTTVPLDLTIYDIENTEGIYWGTIIFKIL